MRSDSERLRDIIEAIENIERRISAGRDAFFQDELLQVWAIHHIQIVGEAAANLSPTLTQRYPSLPWSDIVGMRNVLVHRYFGIDLQQVWDTVTIDLPQLKQDTQKILKDQDP
ncbi:MAG: DUF86 domain-containing protein [Planctomycetes bacterium]|nr:DUF86 domain-containing protein [Planctomycetota bacterium]